MPGCLSVIASYCTKQGEAKVLSFTKLNASLAVILVFQILEEGEH